MFICSYMLIWASSWITLFIFFKTDICSKSAILDFFSPDLSNINYLKHMLAPWNDNFAAIAMVMLYKYLKSHVYTFRYIDLTPSCYCYAICLLSHDGSVYGNLITCFNGYKNYARMNNCFKLILMWFASICGSFELLYCSL